MCWHRVCTMKTFVVLKIVIMKKIFYSLAVALLVVGSAVAQDMTLQKLQGTWLRTDGVGLEVLDSTTVYIVYGAEKKEVLSYKADFTKSPAWFDFTVKHGDTTLRIKSLIFLIDDDILKWQVFEGDKRPVYFSSSRGEMVYLKRMKTLVN